MNRTLLNAFRHELRFLRQIGDEFARAHPQYGGALASNAEGAGDPFVERLLEGVAFLTAKTACRLDSEGERLAHDVLRATMPDMLHPLPPGAMVELQPLHSLPAGADNRVPRGSSLRYQCASGDEIAFRTVVDVQLLPLRLKLLEAPNHKAVLKAMSASVVGSLGRSLAQCDVLRAELSTLGGQSLAASIRNRLPVHCAGPDAFGLWSALTQKVQALLIVSLDGEDAAPLRVHGFPRLFPSGWSDEEALLPHECAIPGPYRLVREWAHWPHRFACGELRDLADGLKGFTGERVELWWFLSKDALPAQLLPDSLRLFCTPVVNVERVRCDPIALSTNASEYSALLPGQVGHKYRLVGLDRVDYRSGDGHWSSLLPVEQIYRQSGGDCYALRVLPRWASQPGRNSTVSELEWLISPSVQASHPKGGAEFLAVNVWASRTSVSDIVPDDGSRWVLDYAAPLLATRGVGYALSGQPVPVASIGLLRAAMVRFERLTRLGPEDAAQLLRTWLGGVEEGFDMPGVHGLRVELTSRCVPWSVQPVHAHGFMVIFELDSVLSLDDQMAGWLHIVAATLARQLSAQAFVVARCMGNDRLLAECVVWG
jgi:type VI secretion system VasI/ImpG family protein